MKNTTLLFIAFVCISSFGQAQTIAIGAQVWTTKNLDVSAFRNGDVITQAKTDVEWKIAGQNHQPAWCYFNNNEENRKTYGKLYNWYAVNDARGLAPKGWHVPRYEEWRILESFLGEGEAAQKMKTLNDWKAVDQTMGGVPGNNESGFRALPAGSFTGTQFHEIGLSTIYWSVTKNYPTIWLYYWFGNLQIYEITNDSLLSIGCSVRCLKD